jgi:hypothetical protein
VLNASMVMLVRLFQGYVVHQLNLWLLVNCIVILGNVYVRQLMLKIHIVLGLCTFMFLWMYIIFAIQTN